MTTILGIKANFGVEGIVLAADRQVSYYDDEDHLYKKETTCKIIYGDSWIMADAGGMSNPFLVFQKSPKKEIRELIEEAVQKYNRGPTWLYPHFDRINQINTLARRVEPEGDLHELIIAAKVRGKLGLWYVDEFGNLNQSQKNQEFEYLTLGTGDQRVIRCIDNLLNSGSIDQTKITIPVAIDIAVAALEAAEKDPNTGGLDLAVLTAKGTYFHGEKIRQRIEAVKTEELASIKQDYVK